MITANITVNENRRYAEQQESIYEINVPLVLINEGSLLAARSVDELAILETKSQQVLPLVQNKPLVAPMPYAPIGEEINGGFWGRVLEIGVMILSGIAMNL